MNHTANMATTCSADVTRLLKVFGLESRRVSKLEFVAEAASIITLHVECEIGEDELAALVAEFEANPPKQLDFVGLKYRPSLYQPATKD